MIRFQISSSSSSAAAEWRLMGSREFDVGHRLLICSLIQEHLIFSYLWLAKLANIDMSNTWWIREITPALSTKWLFVETVQQQCLSFNSVCKSVSYAQSGGKGIGNLERELEQDLISWWEGDSAAWGLRDSRCFHSHRLQDAVFKEQINQLSSLSRLIAGREKTERKSGNEIQHESEHEDGELDWSSYSALLSPASLIQSLIPSSPFFLRCTNGFPPFPLTLSLSVLCMCSPLNSRASRV